MNGDLEHYIETAIRRRQCSECGRTIYPKKQHFAIRTRTRWGTSRVNICFRCLGILARKYCNVWKGRKSI